jgi:hypothetical protein
VLNTPRCRPGERSQVNKDEASGLRCSLDGPTDVVQISAITEAYNFRDPANMAVRVTDQFWQYPGQFVSPGVGKAFPYHLFG